MLCRVLTAPSLVSMSLLRPLLTPLPTRACSCLCLAHRWCLAVPATQSSLLASLILFDIRPRPIALLISMLDALRRALVILFPIILVTVMVTCLLMALVTPLPILDRTVVIIALVTITLVNRVFTLLLRTVAIHFPVSLLMTVVIAFWSCVAWVLLVLLKG